MDETIAWCDRCTGERRFRFMQADVARKEMESPSPDITKAMSGEGGWVCTNCGNFRRNLISEEGYEYEYSDVGYTVPQFRDEETTIREAKSEGVEPASAVADAVDLDTRTAVADTEKERTEEEPDPRDADVA